MQDLVLKFSLLDHFQQRQLLDFLDFLLQNKKKEKPEFDFDWDVYKQDMLSMPTWTKTELGLFEESKKQINEWNIPKW